MNAYDPSLPIVSCDTETELFGPGNMAPRSVCYSFARRFDGRIKTEIFDHVAGPKCLRGHLEQAIKGGRVIAGHNLPYDVAVASRELPEILPLFFDAYELGRVHCTMAAEWVIDTAQGLLRLEWNEDKLEWSTKKSYSLENLARLYWGQEPYKSEWRLRYGELRETALSLWPKEATWYPQQDAGFTLRIAENQRRIAAGILPHDPLVASLAHACRTYLALHLVSCWGEEIDPDRVAELNRVLAKYQGSFVPSLKKKGLLVETLRGKNAGKISEKKKPLMELVARDLAARGIYEGNWEDLIVAPMECIPEEDWDDYLTKGGKSGNRVLQTSSAILADAQDPTLAEMAAYKGAKKLITSFGSPLASFGRGPLHSRYGMAETYRTTCSGGGKRNRMGLNMQQMPRKIPDALEEIMLEEAGEIIDVRSCFVPRPGWVQSSSDYEALEMCTFAQACKWLVGYSTLGDAINDGIKPHVLFASDLLGSSYEETLARVQAGDEEAEAMRQRAKVGNFGYPGGMGAKKFMRYAKGQGVLISFKESRALKEKYKERWSESADYFDLVGEITATGRATILGLASDAVMGGKKFTDACNCFFQELAAFGATRALWRIVRECYDVRLCSVLLGSRCVAFVHDDYRMEHPEEAAHDAAERTAEIARETMQETVPDVRIDIEPALMRRWWKKAKTVRGEDGRLQVWEPEAA